MVPLLIMLVGFRIEDILIVSISGILVLFLFSSWVRFKITVLVLEQSKKLCSQLSQVYKAGFLPCKLIVNAYKKIDDINLPVLIYIVFAHG